MWKSYGIQASKTQPRWALPFADAFITALGRFLGGMAKAYYVKCVCVTLSRYLASDSTSDVRCAEKLKPKIVRSGSVALWHWWILNLRGYFGPLEKEFGMVQHPLNNVCAVCLSKSNGEETRINDESFCVSLHWCTLNFLMATSTEVFDFE